MLALILKLRVCKNEIASAYLSVAFYGTASVGIAALRDRFGADLDRVPFRHALRLVAQLKYPSPASPGVEWQVRSEARYRALLRLAYGTANKSLQRSGTHKVPGRGRSSAESSRVLRARVLKGRRAAAELGR